MDQIALQRQAEHGHTSGESGFSGRRSMAPPAFQLKASSNAPIQRVGEPKEEAKQEQMAGTCGIYALINSIAFLYGLNAAESDEVKANMLLAAGQSGAKVTGQGEITSFGIALKIITKYNKLLPQFEVNIEPRTVETEPKTQEEWRGGLAIPKDEEEHHAATLAIDSAILGQSLSAAFTEKELEEKSILTLTKVIGEASEKGSGGHWVTIVGVTNTHLVIMDPNCPHQKIEVPIDQAHLLSTSLKKGVPRGEYLKAVYQGANDPEDRNEEGFVKGLTYEEEKYNEDYKAMEPNVDDPNQEIVKRLKQTEKNELVQLNGLAIKVTRKRKA